MYAELKEIKKTGNAVAIVKKKTGTPTLLPEKLMQKTIETISALRLRVARVSSAVANAVAKGLVLYVATQYDIYS